MLDLRFLSRGLSPEGIKVPKCRGYAINSRISASPSGDYFAQGKLVGLKEFAAVCLLSILLVVWMQKLNLAMLVGCGL